YTLVFGVLMLALSFRLPGPGLAVDCILCERCELLADAGRVHASPRALLSVSQRLRAGSRSGDRHRTFLPRDRRHRGEIFELARRTGLGPDLDSLSFVCERGPDVLRIRLGDDPA